MTSEVPLRPKKGRPSGALTIGSPTWLARWEATSPGGRKEILSVLRALPSPNTKLIVALEASSKEERLSDILKRAEMGSAEFMALYLSGVEARSKTRALLIAHGKVPALAADLATHALDQITTCLTCGGQKVANLKLLKGSDQLVKCWGCNGKGVAPKSEVEIVFSGPFAYDDARVLALRAMTMVLQSRLFDTIRQELGGTYNIDARPETQKFPQPMYSVRIDWTCDPARTAMLVQRVFDEIRFVKNTSLSPNQVARIRSALLREFEANSQNNGYLLSQISRRYENREADGVATMVNLPDQIAALTGDAIQQAARTYLDTGNYVKVTLMPEAR